MAETGIKKSDNPVLYHLIKAWEELDKEHMELIANDTITEAEYRNCKIKIEAITKYIQTRLYN